MIIVALIESLETEGNRISVTARAEGDRYPDVPLIWPLGIRLPVAVGDPCLLMPFDGAVGEFVAVAMTWANNSLTTSKVALLSDVESLRSTYLTHSHPANGSPPSPPEPPAPIGSEFVEVT